MSEWDKCPTCTATNGDKSSDHDLDCELTVLRARLAALTALANEWDVMAERDEQSAREARAQWLAEDGDPDRIGQAEAVYAAGARRLRGCANELRALDASRTPRGSDEAPPCGGSRCHRAADGTWIHSSKSYDTCSARGSDEGSDR